MRDAVEVTGNASLYFLTALQTKEIFQIISLVLSIIISCLIIIGKVVEWYKQSKSDGKVTKDEIKNLVDITKEDVKNIKEDIDSIVNKDEKGGK